MLIMIRVIRIENVMLIFIISGIFFVLVVVRIKLFLIDMKLMIWFIVLCCEIIMSRLRRMIDRVNVRFLCVRVFVVVVIGSMIMMDSVIRLIFVSIVKLMLIIGFMVLWIFSCKMMWCNVKGIMIVLMMSVIVVVMYRCGVCWM